MGKITVELYLSTFGTLNHPNLFSFCNTNIEISLLISALIKKPTWLNKKPADKNEWPWMAALLRYDREGKSSPWPFCGASLISEEYLLTAAKCILRFA